MSAIESFNSGENGFWFVLYFIEALVIIFCNVVAIIIFTKKARQSRSCILLVNQSIADLLVGAEVIHFSLQFTPIDQHHHHVKGCKTWEDSFKIAIWCLVIDASLTSLACISVERAYAVFKPFHHRVLSSRIYYFWIAVMWIACSIPSVCIFVFRCMDVKSRHKVTFGLSTCSMMSSLLTIIVAYTSIYIKIKFFPSVRLNCHSQRQFKVCRTLFYASVASAVTFLPSCLMQSIYFPKAPPSHAYTATMLLLFANSFVNFFIYSWRFPDFNADLKRLFCCKRMSNDVNSDVVAAEMSTWRRNTKTASNSSSIRDHADGQ